MPLKITRGGIEPPPKEYRGKPPADIDIVELLTREEVRKACEDRGHAAHDPYGHGRSVYACYDPPTHTAFIIKRGQLRDKVWQEEFDHEVLGHGNGLVHHPNGRGWKPAEAPPATFDWSKVFGTQTATTGPAPTAEELARAIRARR